jgi:SnoaL-like domain
MPWPAGIMLTAERFVSATWEWRGTDERQDNRDTLERYRQEFFERQNIDAIANLKHEDYVEDYPQSGERIRGKDNTRTADEDYPGIPNLVGNSYRLVRDLAVVEMIPDDEGKRMNVCEIVEFENGKIAEPFEAPEGPGVRC